MPIAPAVAAHRRPARRAADVHLAKGATTRRRATTSASLVLLLAAAAAPASAQTFAVIMRGVLDGRSGIVSGGATTPLAGPTPFTLRAYFDAASPNLMAGAFPFPVPGFVAYRPAAVRLTLGGRTYAVQPFDAANPAGVAVAIFDSTTPFGVPNRYGVGLIQDPVLDGAGFIADYVGASPSFVIGAGGVVPTTFTGYAGVGFSSGVCTVGTPASCQQHAVTPIPITRGGQAFALSLGSYEEHAAQGAPRFSTRIAVVPGVVIPEPGTVALVGLGVLGLGAAAARRRRAA